MLPQDEMTGKLQMQFNRMRQAAITNELVDIISAAPFSRSRLRTAFSRSTRPQPVPVRSKRASEWIVRDGEGRKLCRRRATFGLLFPHLRRGRACCRPASSPTRASLSVLSSRRAATLGGVDEISTDEARERQLVGKRASGRADRQFMTPAEPSTPAKTQRKPVGQRGEPSEVNQHLRPRPQPRSGLKVLLHRVTVLQDAACRAWCVASVAHAGCSACRRRESPLEERPVLQRTARPAIRRA